jgi:hypothetical protein
MRTARDDLRRDPSPRRRLSQVDSVKDVSEGFSEGSALAAERGRRVDPLRCCFPDAAKAVFIPSRALGVSDESELCIPNRAHVSVRLPYEYAS